MCVICKLADFELGSIYNDALYVFVFVNYPRQGFRRQGVTGSVSVDCGVACMLTVVSVSMSAWDSLFSVVRGRGPLALVPTWLGGGHGSSWRGRFGDSGVSMKPSSIAARAAAAREGGGARSMTLSVY